jgi:cytoskeletal protein RodZ
MADDANDVQAAEITLDDFNADEQETAKVDPSPTKEAPKAADKEPVADKTEAAKTAETKDEAQADDTAAPPDVPVAKDTETEATSDETDTAKAPTKAEERKSQLNTEIRDLVSQRNALRTEVEKANAEVYQPATENELVDQGLSATDAKVEALRQQIEMRDYNERVAEAQLTLSSESQRVLNDFPIFNPDSDSFDAELAQEAADTLGANLLVDDNSKQLLALIQGFRLISSIKPSPELPVLAKPRAS